MPLRLSPFDHALLAGGHGEAAAFAMRLLVRFAEAVDAPRLLDIEAAHVDGCLYLGRASLDFVDRLAALRGRVRVPTTLDVGSGERPRRLWAPVLEETKAHKILNDLAICRLILQSPSRFARLHVEPPRGYSRGTRIQPR